MSGTSIHDHPPTYGQKGTIIINKRYTGSALASVTAVALLLLCASPAQASEPPPTELQTVALASEQLDQVSVSDSEAVILEELIAAVDQRTRTYDERVVAQETLSSDSGRAFEQTILDLGGTVIAPDGSVRSSAAVSNSVQALASGGRIWTDAWGVHFTASSAVIGQLVAAAAGAGGSAAAIAGVLALNMEGFPANVGGAAAAGVIAAALFASAGVLSLCNLGGNGAQFNYNWITWTCWPL